MKHIDAYAVTAVVLFLGSLEILFAGYLRKIRKSDFLIDLISVAQLALILKPLIFLTTALAFGWLLPQHEMAWGSTPLWIGILIILIPGDLMHYLYHRKGHEWPWIWRLHRTHHTATHMSAIMSFRENWQWFVFMPDLWYNAIMTYLGFGEAAIYSTLIVGVHNVLNHTAISWDKPIYRIPILRWILERLIQLPSTHRAHHAELNAAGEPPFENYGQTLFIWDWLFGTGKFPRGRDPQAYGVQNDPQDPWPVQLWWPILRSPKKNSVYARRSYKGEGI